MNFGKATKALLEGKRLARPDWNGPFVFMQVPSEIKREIVPKMQSLPQLVKDEFERRFNNPDAQIDAIYYDNQLAMVHECNVITGWAPAVTDVFATDWIILD